MIINHNLAGMNAINKMNANGATASKSMTKLSSGLRINSAADDAAGLAISEKMRGQIRGLDQASANAQDGISMIQTAEGALNETTSILQRMRELATQSANDTNVSVDRKAIQNEMSQLTSEINRIGNTTEFNTQKLLDGGASTSGAKNSNFETSGIAAKGAQIDGLGKVTFTAVGDIASAGETLNISLYDKKATAAVTFSLSGDTFKTLWAPDTGATEQDKRNLLIDIIGNRTASWNTGFTTATTVKLKDVADISIDENGVFSIKNKTAGDVSTTAAEAVISFDVKNLAGTAGSTVSNDFSKMLGFGNPAAKVFSAGTSATAAATLSSLSASGIDQTEAKLYGGVEVQNGDRFDAADFAGKSYTVKVNDKEANITLATNLGDPATGKILSSALKTAFQNALDSTFGSGAVTVSFAAKEGTTAGTETYWKFTTNTASVEAAVNGENEVTDGVQPSFSISGDNLNKLLGDYVSGSSSSGGTFNSTLQIGANQGQSLTVSIGDMRAKALDITGTAAGMNHDAVAGARYTETKSVTDGTSSTGTEYALDVSTHDRASAAVKVVNNAIEKVSEQRSQLGAYQNRLEHTINNLGTSSENLTSAESRIRDVDMAKEMSTFSKNNILSQAAQAMLAQANQQPQQVLQLLR